MSQHPIGQAIGNITSGFVAVVLPLLIVSVPLAFWKLVDIAIWVHEALAD